MEFQYAVPSSAQHTQGTGGTWGSGLPARRTTHAFFSQTYIIARTAAAPSFYLIISKSSALFLIEKSGPRSVL
jgi:hypothetical protein